MRVADGLLVEHWDVLQDEAAREESLSGRPMFGGNFAVAADEATPEPPRRVPAE